MDTREIRVSLLQKHIATGRRVNCERCPIALALKDSIQKNGAHDHFAGPVDLMFEDNTGRWRAECPDVARKFITAFDRGEPVEPFEFVAVFRRPPKPVIKYLKGGRP